LSLVNLDFTGYGQGGGAILDRAWKFRVDTGSRLWDTLIVSSAKPISSRHLLTDGWQADQDLRGIVIANPFVIPRLFNQQVVAVKL
jgi:hypothetical protein